MIRPFTCLAFLLACGSGLYLYQSKHRVKVLDEQIEQTVKSTDALREQTRMLSAEWTLLNDPERLRQLASQFLTLQTVSPNQFTSLADLDSRLPPPVPPGSLPSGGAPADLPVAANAPAGSGADEGKPTDAKLAAAALPAAPPTAAKDAAQATASAAAAPRVAAAMPTDKPHPVEEARAAEHKPPVTHSAPPQPRLVSYQPHPADQHAGEIRPDIRSADQRVPDQRGPDQHASDPRAPDPRAFAPRAYEQRIAETRPMPAARLPAPMPIAPMQSGGSLLGMAHGVGAPPMPLPLPRPMPVNAPNWSYSNGG
jgi:hypothetical protein